MIRIVIDKKKASKVASKSKRIGSLLFAGFIEVAEHTYQNGRVVATKIHQEIKK